jgi:signal peptidase I
MHSEALAAAPELPRRRIVTAAGVWRVVSLTLTLSLAVFWFVALRPAQLGGPAAYVLVSGESMLPTLKDGDLVLTRSQESYRVGDMVAYRVPQGEANAGAHVIHRIIGGSERDGFLIQGDNRTAPDMWRPKTRDMIGKVALRIPHGVNGLQLLRSPLLLACLASGFAIVFFVPRREKS